jgi:ketosteroid isomerase-like protein
MGRALQRKMVCSRSWPRSPAAGSLFSSAGSSHKRGYVLSVSDYSAIEALHKAWLRAELRGHPTALLGFCTPVPVWLPPNEPPLCGAPAILHWLEDQTAGTVQRIDIDHLEITGIGSFACKLATFRTTLQNPADAGAAVVTGTHTWLLQRDDGGSWRIGVVAWTIVPTAPA